MGPNRWPMKSQPQDGWSGLSKRFLTLRHKALVSLSGASALERLRKLLE